MAVSEFRKDLVSGEWVLIASGRARRPDAPENKRPAREPSRKESCPFEDPQASGNAAPVLAYHGGTRIQWTPGTDWSVQVIPNKFPALTPGVCGAPERTGPFLTHPAHGFHELVVTRDHERGFAQFTGAETAEVLKVYRERFREIAKDECGDYVSIFHNWGRTAGASVYHNHSQIISTPVLPPEVLRSVSGADAFYRTHDEPVHRRLIQWEMNQGRRMVYENGAFVAFCPYVSKTPYEVRIFPKRHEPRFENIRDDEIEDCAQALNAVLGSVYDALGDPDYNFYIHTAPVTKDPAVSYDFYHWHIEIVPRISVPAGFELGTAIYINVVDPDDAAAKLREAVRNGST
ncbi:MAG TPA: DUF4921 family protein [Candidatus Paceibacterota bacterium]|nr:DUF4921 family protein [Candidatus Paceibacterota bacterium]